MTHRVVSRNASSSRAVPVSKNLEEVRSDELRASPVYWGAEQKGMQSGAELEGMDLSYVRDIWRKAALDAADWAERMSERGAHKSIVNRILEPFLHINVVATATEWMNFFGLRLHRDAQPEMRVLAETMWRAYCTNPPKELKPGEWHLPFVDDSDWEISDNLTSMIRVSVARSARVSYTSFETGRRSTVDEDLRLYEKLVGAQPLHASPAEHQATPDEYTLASLQMSGGWAPHLHRWTHPEEHGNFVGYRQYRKMLPGESLAPLPEEYRA